MKISLIVAMARNHIIGIDNQLPWKLPADLAWFKKNSMGKPLLMGRKTWESLPFRPLPGRKHFVITRNPDYQAKKPDGTFVAEVSVLSSVNEAIAQAKTYCQNSAESHAEEINELIIMGGATIYAETLELCDRMYLTIIDEDISGDAKFPQFDVNQWTENFRQECLADEKNPHNYKFVIFDKNDT